MEEKHIIFVVGSLACVPAGILLATSNRRIRDFIFFALVLGTTQPDSIFGLPTDINFLSREWYNGTTRGIEISYLDLLALILLFSSLIARRRERLPFFWPPSLGLLLAFFAWSIFNVLVVSDPKIFGLFELTKMARGILVFIAVTAYVRSSREVRLFVWALIIAISYEAAVCLRDRYIFGEYRISGTLAHPNSLSMYALQCLPIFISTIFVKDISPRLRTCSALASVMASGTVILSISRTGFAALFVVCIVSLILNVRFRLTPRNVIISVIFVMFGTLMTLKAWDSITSRFAGFDLQREYLTQEGDRGSYFRKGVPALRDNPISGVGLNNWSYWISNRYGAEAGYHYEPYPSTNSPPDVIGQDAPAHNLYLITAVELGWPGLILLMALIVHWLRISGSVLITADETLTDRICLGAFLSLCGVLMQSVTEWEFRQTSMFFLGHIVMAVATVIYYNKRRIRNYNRRRLHRV